MKFNNYIYSILFVTTSIFSTSCQDMFSPEVDNVQGEEFFITNPAATALFLNAGYVLLPTTYDFSECATDDAVINNPTSGFLPMVGGAWSSTFDPLSVWSNSYTAIANLNKFLTYSLKMSWTSAVDDSLYKKRMTAEAHGLRAYHHFLLLRHYGGVGTSGKLLGVPYLTSMKDLDQSAWINIERPDYKSTVDSIVKDLDFAIKNLPEVYVGTDRALGVRNKNRLTSWIALAMKAELYMHAASPKYNGGVYNVAYCDSAIKYSGKLIDHIGGINAMADVLKINQFYTNDENEFVPEILWRLDQTSEATSAGSMSQTIESKNYPPSLSGNGQVNPTQDFVDAFPALNGYPITDILKSGYVAATPYLKRDIRLDLCVIRDGGTLNGTIINTSKDKVKDGIENQGATRTGYYLKKLLRPDFSITNPMAGKKTIRPFIRYTELYLIFAEAATAAYGADWKGGSYTYSARDAIKAIRKRAGITNRDVYATSLTADLFMDLVRNERRIELAFEGFRFVDLRRWGLETNVTLHRARILVAGGTPTILPIDDEPRNFTTFKYFAPIPNSEILKCPKLEQNASN